MSALAHIWADNHEITEADLDALDRSVAVPDLETMAHLTSNIQRIMGLGKGPDDAPTLDE